MIGMTTQEIEARVLTQWKRIAVVGLSDRSSRPSYGVTQYMRAQGYEIFPVNPLLTGWLGLPAYPDLAAAPPPIEIVNVFRRSEHVGTVVDEAIRVGAKAVWLQEGVVDEAASRRAEDAGLLVVRDRCILKAHRALRS